MTFSNVGQSVRHTGETQKAANVRLSEYIKMVCSVGSGSLREERVILQKKIKKTRGKGISECQQPLFCIPSVPFVQVLHV